MAHKSENNPVKLLEETFAEIEKGELPPVEYIKTVEEVLTKLHQLAANANTRLQVIEQLIEKLKSAA